MSRVRYATSVVELTDAIPLGFSAPQDLVPGGAYRLSERVGGEVEIEAFWLDRYPVTVDRYARFIDSGGYDEPDHWDDEGWFWRTLEDVEAPRFWHDDNWPLFRRFVRPNRPVVGVSWHEAQAFCRFEGRQLPTELQWEAAASGPTGLEYPWGRAWDGTRVGVRGVGPRVTWPVGYWPRSVAPFGHHDMIGNLWQWTLDDFDENFPDKGKAVRGGSWASRPDQNRNRHFNGYHVEGRHSHVGFRTCTPVAG